PQSEEGTLAKIHQALQPGLAEIFFAPFLILTEGREDIAYVLTYLTLMNSSDSLRRAGCHLVPTDGKRNLLMPLAIANHLHIPTFVVFDADGHRPDKMAVAKSIGRTTSQYSVWRVSPIRTPSRLNIAGSVRVSCGALR